MASLTKVKVPVLSEEKSDNTNIYKSASSTLKATPTKSIQFLTSDKMGSTTLEPDFSQTKSSFIPSVGHPSILKKSSQLDIKTLMPHPPRDFLNLNTTNFAM